MVIKFTLFPNLSQPKFPHPVQHFSPLFFRRRIETFLNKGPGATKKVVQMTTEDLREILSL